MALEIFAYPQELKYKLLERKAKCRMAFKKVKEAKEDVQLTLKALDSSNLKEEKKETLKKELLQMLEKTNYKENDSEIQERNQDEFMCPFKLRSKHQRFPAFSDSLDILYSVEKGRHVVANVDVKAGEVLVVEDPLVASLSADFASKNCHHCFR